MIEIIDSTRTLTPLFQPPTDARLTEGITYCGETDTLYWIDIYKAQIHRIQNFQKDPPPFSFESNYDFVTISQENYNESIFGVPYPREYSQYKESIGVIFPNDNSDSHLIYFGSKFGIGRYDYKTSQWGYMILYSSCEEIGPYSYRLRSNDGNVTPDGKYIVVGLMEDFMYDASRSKKGCVIRVDLVSKKIEMMVSGLKIPNAIHWSQDCSKMYITDSLNFTIWEYEYDEMVGRLVLPHRRRALIDIRRYNTEFESPEPDGSDIDLTNGLLYVSVWSTSQIQVYDIQTGELVKRYLLPLSTPRISCCCLVGNDLLVTCANQYITDDERLKNGLANKDTEGGCIYRIENVTQDMSPTRSSKRTLKF